MHNIQLFLIQNIVKFGEILFFRFSFHQLIKIQELNRIDIWQNSHIEITLRRAVSQWGSMIDSKMHQTSHNRFHHFNALLRSIYLIVCGIASFLLELLVSNLVRIVLVLWLYKKYTILSVQMKLITAFVFVVFFCWWLWLDIYSWCY